MGEGWLEAQQKNSIYQVVALLELPQQIPETKMPIPLISSNIVLSLNFISSKTMANAGGSKNATLNKPGAAYAQKGGNDLESLMAKFNNSLAIQNLMNNNVN
jgi:hypothetical protein